MLSPASPPPTPPEGDLRQTPVARLLVQLQRRRASGRLVLRDDTGDESTVYLRDGYPVHVERPNEVDRLDRVLTELNLVSGPVLARAQEIALQNEQRLGQALLELRALLPEKLVEALRLQLRRKLVRLFFARSGRYRFHADGHAFGTDELGRQIRVDPRCLAYPGIRAAYDAARAGDELRALAGVTFRLANLPPGALEALGFAPGDVTIEALKQRTLRLEDLGGLAPRPLDAQAVVLALHHNELLVTSPVAATGAPTAARKPSPPAPPRTAPVPPQPPAHAELRAQLSSIAAKLDATPHHELLGVPDNATPEQVSAAYLKAVRQFHPDRMAGLGLGDLAPAAERVMARLGEASSVLSDPKRRAEYQRKLRGEPSEADLARAILEAEVVFKRGETALKNGDVVAALQAFTESVKKNPSEPQYRAYLAWARYCDPSARKEFLARETLRLINDVLKDRPHFAVGHHWIGEIHKYLGDLVSAEAAFRRAVEADKDFLDAQRELRLIDMRRAKGMAAKSAAAPSAGASTQNAATTKPGLLGKLLRR